MELDVIQLYIIIEFILYHLPNLIVIFRSNSFLKRTVCTPDMALTTVDLPWATWPIVPILIVACREMTSGESAVSFEISYKNTKHTELNEFTSSNK